MAAKSLKHSDPVVPPGFIARKSKILSDLSVPDAEYTDLSPKGSVDEGIRDLIRDINALDGLVTTSSCAGRVSVFVEGSKKTGKKRKTAARSEATSVEDSVASNQPVSHQNQSQVSAKEQEGEEDREDGDGEGRKFAPTGGKGEGRWLFVSHDPVNLDNVGASCHDLFGLVPGDGIPKPNSTSDDGSIRLIRFHYDPMILHVMTATLHHAHPVLAAASSAGFRESGLQSLRCLEVPPYSSGLDQHRSSTDGSSHSPIVAVRSSGLALESVIGYCDFSHGDAEPVMRSLVKEEYLQMLVALANERFDVNKERVERFRTKLLHLFAISLNASQTTTHKKKHSDWEDPQARKERKRAEGLKRQAEKTQQNTSASTADEADIDMNLDF